MLVLVGTTIVKNRSIHAKTYLTLLKEDICCEFGRSVVMDHLDISGRSSFSSSGTRNGGTSRVGQNFLGRTLDSGAKCLVHDCACAVIYVEPRPLITGLSYLLVWKLARTWDSSPHSQYYAISGSLQLAVVWSFPFTFLQSLPPVSCRKTLKAYYTSL